MSREEHLTWCKARALEYLDAGDLTNAVASMGSDLGKHPETATHANGLLMQAGLMAVIDDDAPAVRRWIEGFN
jgi:hypothetical protein